MPSLPKRQNQIVALSALVAALGGCGGLNIGAKSSDSSAKVKVGAGGVETSASGGGTTVDTRTDGDGDTEVSTQTGAGQSGEDGDSASGDSSTDKPEPTDPYEAFQNACGRLNPNAAVPGGSITQNSYVTTSVVQSSPNAAVSLSVDAPVDVLCLFINSSNISITITANQNVAGIYVFGNGIRTNTQMTVKSGAAATVKAVFQNGIEEKLTITKDAGGTLTCTDKQRDNGITNTYACSP